jgi:hypothetical protein
MRRGGRGLGRKGGREGGREEGGVACTVWIRGEQRRRQVGRKEGRAVAVEQRSNIRFVCAHIKKWVVVFGSFDCRKEAKAV